MPASVVTITGRREGTYVLLEAALPGKPPQNIGVLLMDAVEDRAWLRLRQNFHDLAEPEDAEVLEAIEEDIRAKVAESGAEAYLRSIEDSLSNVLRVSQRQTVAVDAFTRVVDRLYEENVAPIPVKPF